MVLLLHFKIYPKFSTFLELDYDTPWDNRHIAEDMRKRKSKRKSENVIRKSFGRFRLTFRQKSLPGANVIKLVTAVSYDFSK